MHTIDSYEVTLLHDDGEMLLTTNPLAHLSYPDEGTLAAVIEGTDLLVQAETPFRIARLPSVALEYLALSGKITLAELENGEVVRLATLGVSS